MDSCMDSAPPAGPMTFFFLLGIADKFFMDLLVRNLIELPKGRSRHTFRAAEQTQVSEPSELLSFLTPQGNQCFQSPPSFQNFLASGISEPAKLSELSERPELSEPSKLSELSELSEPSKLSKLSKLSELSEPSKLSKLSELSELSEPSELDPLIRFNPKGRKKLFG